MSRNHIQFMVAQMDFIRKSIARQAQFGPDIKRVKKAQKKEARVIAFQNVKKAITSLV